MSLEVLYIDAPRGAQESGTEQSTEKQPWSSNVLPQNSDIPFATLEGETVKSVYKDGNLSISSPYIQTAYSNGNLDLTGILDSKWENGNVSVFVADKYRADLWPLDGSRKIMPDSPKDIGWWSKEMSDVDGRFAVNPKITIKFPVSYTATGLTFTFNPATNQWCSELKVSWYSDQTLIRETDYFPTGARWVLEELVEGFDRIVIEIKKTNNSFQFAKIQNIMIGQSIHFGRDEIISASVTSEADHKLCELTVDTMRLEIHDRAKRKLLPQEGQRVELYQNNNLVAANYIKDSTREAPFFYTVSCQSAIGLLEDTFLGGMYDNIPLETLVSEILSDMSYEVSPSFSKRTVSGYLPVCSKREALQQVAFAVGALVTTQGTDAIKLDPIQTSVTSSFNADRIFSGARVTTEKLYAKVEVATHSYTKSNETEDIVSGEMVDGENVLITFEEPHHGYTITGGTITGSGVNWVTVTANGEITISAKKYVHNSVMKSRRNSFATANEQSNVMTVDSATLITSANIDSVLNRLYEASTLRAVLSEEVVVHGENCGQRVSSLNPWGTQTRGYIVAMSSDYTQRGQTASVTIRGIEVETEPIYCYAGELYAGSNLC